MTNTLYTVSARHASPRFAFTDHEAVAKPSPGLPGKWYATSDGLGCSKDYNSPEAAVRSLFTASACTSIVIKELPTVKQITFEQFQATRTHCDDLGKTLNDAAFEDYAKPASGNIYLGCLCIEAFEGEWVLTIGNTSGRSADLEALERDLFEFAKSEGHCAAHAEQTLKLARDFVNLWDTWSDGNEAKYEVELARLCELSKDKGACDSALFAPLRGVILDTDENPDDLTIDEALVALRALLKA